VDWSEFKYQQTAAKTDSLLITSVTSAFCKLLFSGESLENIAGIDALTRCQTKNI